MAQRNNIPKSATLAKKAVGFINDPGGPNHGKEAFVKLWEAYQSDGYKTNYEHRLVRHFEVWVDGWKRPWRKRYSGEKRLAQAMEEFDEMAEVIVATNPLQMTLNL